MEKVYRFAGWTALIVAGVVVLLRAVAISWWQLPLRDNDLELSASIAPSLQGGDWVLSWRLTQPSIGDLVQCPDPDDPTNIVIGRVVAEGGDLVVIDGQLVMINNSKPEIEYNCTEQTFSLINPDTRKEASIYCDMEDIGEKLHKRGHDGTPKKGRFEKRVEPGKIFLLSDNRVHPFDSRHFGTLERGHCKETIFFRLVSAAGFFDQPNRLSFIR